MAEKDAINDNKRRENGLDPDLEYVRDYLHEAIAHFRACKIDQGTILEGLGDILLSPVGGLVKYLLPKAGPVDESAMLSELHFLWPLEANAEIYIKQRLAALDRAEAERAARKAAVPESAD